MYVCMCVCVCVCMYACMRVSLCIHVSIDSRCPHPSGHTSKLMSPPIATLTLILYPPRVSVKKTLGHRMHRGIKMVLMVNQTRSFHSQSKKRSEAVYHLWMPLSVSPMTTVTVL